MRQKKTSEKKDHLQKDGKDLQKYDPTKLEQDILAHWEKNKTYTKAKAQNKRQKPFYFLDGPPYTSGRVHLGTAWNKALKDMIVRYQRMKGLDVFDRACYDMHGLPIEHKVQEQHKLKTKEDIVTFGMAKFIEECRKFSVENLQLMNQEFTQMGVWLDYENAYMPITDEAIEGIWWLIEQVHQQGRLYEGLRSMTWCGNCATALAKHELEYQPVTDKSIFVKLKVRDKDEYLIIWTTTPWTIPFNMGVMVHPEFEYVRCSVEDANGETETWIVAKALANVFISGAAGKKFKVLETITGEKLKNLEYVHPFEQLLPQYAELRKQGKRIHRVVLSAEHVDTTAGTGLVHCAPGCGPEDYEVGHREGLPIWNTISETAEFPAEMGIFAEKTARRDDKYFTEVLADANAIVHSTSITHDYPHCWRCHKPVVFRTTKQWFFKVEDLKQQMLAENKKIQWVPEAAFNAFDSWLANLRDNSITKQRFWGTPLPVWRCDRCAEWEVVNTKKDIEKKWGKRLKDLHKPWIDEAQWKCSCGGMRTRIPDVMDVWIDPGCISWTALGYPQEKKVFEKLFPADFILEGKDQIRGWFNVLMVCGMLGLGRVSFRAAYMHGFVQDAEGRKMSKSLGNIVAPQEVISQYGADTLRYYTISSAAPGLDLSYNVEDAKAKHRNLTVLWNLHKYVIDLARTLGITPDELSIHELKQVFGTEELYMLSVLHRSIAEITASFVAYQLNEIPLQCEALFLSLSRTYIQLTREKVTSGTDQEKQAVLWVVSETLRNGLVLFAPVCPFITEQMYLNLREAFGWQSESIHLLPWPNALKQFQNAELEQSMDIAQQIITGALAGREKIKRGVRWPMQSLIVVTEDASVIAAVQQLTALIQQQSNVKKIEIQPRLPGVKLTVRGDYGKLGPDFGARSPKIIAKLSLQ
ncbi:MAG TPA: isoleucine--tRNA ligase, partial [Candidatus Nanoarchaeia archaeon]|nr:isoleucine--tRNA ligase [Candidatus Nanoarchaeia archaeon]